jgi:tRNA U34 5-carboxymethylaminomethyl modifying GTPase MnmE/TrmE
MDTLKIKGALYTQRKSSKDAVFPLLNKKIILQDDTPIFQFIDNSGVDGNSIHKIKVAREIIFGFEACLKDRYTDRILLRPETLSELIEYLDEGEIAHYRLVLDTDDKDILSEAIQSLLYLDIDMQVMLRSEESARRKMDLFAERFDEFSESLKETKEKIRQAGGGDNLREDSAAISNTLSAVEGLFMEMNRRSLKVAIMALKKSGKSVLVNCFLGDEYAPASIELPTFNSCIYTKSKDKGIALNYQGRHIRFKNPWEVKDYILDEFRNAHVDDSAGYVLDDMEINYVSNDDSLCDYTIIDTPGPDLAGSGHKEIAYKWIGDADVVLFIVDYTKYLTTSEEQFFRDIKTAFERHNKIYSFIVVVNKLDLMYLSEEKKSAVRFIDFLRSRLKGLGYKGFIVLGVSALQYFYAQKALQMKECSDLNTDDGEEFRLCLDALLERYQGKEEMTILSFVDSQIRNLMWFHGSQNATLKTIKEKSGVEQLIKYINYIAVEKAAIELFNHKMSLVDGKIGELEGDYIASQLKKLGEEREDFGKKIEDIAQVCDKLTAGISERSEPVERISGMDRDISLADKSMFLVINMHIDNIIRRLTKRLLSLSGEELIALQNGSQVGGIAVISEEIKRSSIDKNYINVMAKHEKNINKEIGERENILRDLISSAQAKIAEYEGFMKNGKDEINLALPHLSFGRFDFQPMKLTLDGMFDPSFFSGRLVRGRGFAGWLLMIFSLGFVKRKTGRLGFDNIKLKKALFLIRKNLDSAMHDLMSKQNSDLMGHIRTQIDGLNAGISEEIERVIREYRSLFDEIISELARAKRDVESRIEFLEGAEKELEGFYDLWNSFKTGRRTTR